MILWIVIAVMTGSALLAVVMPLLRRRPAPTSARAHDLAVYRDQLAEVERDRGSGLINDDEAAAGRLEIERRILRQGKELEPRPGVDMRPLRLATAVLLVIAVPALALGLYLRLGSPDLPDLPLAGRQQAAIAGAEDPATLAAELERRLADGSGTLGEWLGLARSLMTAGKPADAARAYRRAIELAPQRAELISAYGEALVESNGGSVVPLAREAFEQALAIDPEEPRARFYRGAFLMQQGDLAAAIDVWLQLELDSAPDAPWLAVLEERLGEAARAANVNLVKRRAELASLEAAGRGRMRGEGQAGTRPGGCAPRLRPCALSAGKGDRPGARGVHPDHAAHPGPGAGACRSLVLRRRSRSRSRQPRARGRSLANALVPARPGEPNLCRDPEADRWAERKQLAAARLGLRRLKGLKAGLASPLVQIRRSHPSFPDGAAAMNG